MLNLIIAIAAENNDWAIMHRLQNEIMRDDYCEKQYIFVSLQLIKHCRNPYLSGNIYIVNR